VSHSRSVEIDAPVERCYEIASDIDHAPEWQGSLKDVEVLERYNFTRPHGSLSKKPPASRLTNVVRNYTVFHWSTFVMPPLYTSLLLLAT
jgi:uncharacterized membrane protein